jgi:hypothetical protein
MAIEVVTPRSSGHLSAFWDVAFSSYWSFGQACDVSQGVDNEG